MVIGPLFAAVLIAAAAPSTDPRADDAGIAFSEICVKQIDGGTATLDPARFSLGKLDPDLARRIKPDIGDRTLWDVTGLRSGLHMLLHVEPNGLCVVQVAAADEAAIRHMFDALVAQAAAARGAKVSREQDHVNEVQGLPATTSQWRIDLPGQDLSLAITTYPEPKFMIQHLMTVGFVE